MTYTRAFYAAIANIASSTSSLETTLRGFELFQKRGTGLLQRFVRCNRGATAIMFALSSIALVAASGAAVDISRTIVAKNRLSEALDAAGLAVGTTTGLTQAQQQAL